MEKSIVGLQKLMGIVSIDYKKAVLISRLIPKEKLDYEINEFLKKYFS